jgi:putative photosynthetic complex assembly protein 2
MTEPVAIPMPEDAVADTSGRVVVRSAVATVVGFWWVATGLVIAMQRSAPTRFLALMLASLLAVAGGYELVRARHSLTPQSVRWSFLGGALLWAYVSVAFYGGWIVGVMPQAAGPAAPSVGAALLAIRSTIYSDLLALAMIAAAAALTRGAANRTGLWALVTFWSMQQVAKLAVFFGVENPAGDFLPPHLAPLRQFFGPPHNAPFLWMSVVVVSVIALWCTWRARRAAGSGLRLAWAMHAILLGLAVLELAILSVRMDSTMWEPFLRMRSG